MKLHGNTVLITGGTSGIGYELVAELSKLGNKVIVTGRDEANLDATRQKLPDVHTIRTDVSDPLAIASLYRQVVSEFPELNMLINNAGIMRKINLQTHGDDLADIVREIDINLSGSIRMVMQFLPHLRTRSSAAIINVSSGLAFVPLPISPIYSATKAAIHSFTQSLRLQLKNTNIKVIELAPPGTETPLFHGDFTAQDTGGVTPMPLKTLVRKAISGLKNDRPEIRPGLANILKLMSRVAPDFMIRQLGRSVDFMHARRD